MRRRALLSGGDIDYSEVYFTMVVTTGGDITWTGSITDNTLSYSKDNGNIWTTANSGTTISVTAGDKVLWKGTPTPQSSKGIGTFSGDTNTRYRVEGNVMSLLFGDNFKEQTSLSGKNYALYYLFKSNTNVTSSENLSLPATTLSTNCYVGMFSSCKSLTTAPSELPATTLADSCYYMMFSGCTNLTTAPALPATTLKESCYSYMFQSCTSLTKAPELPATTLVAYCYSSMFSHCTNLTTAPTLPATTLANRCYNSMFSYTNVLPDCTNIDFSSQYVVASGGLQGLFEGTKITDAQLDAILKQHGINNYSLPVTTLAYQCYSSMFLDCTNLTTAPELPATTLAKYCYWSMFHNCTSLTKAPELPATTLVAYCYDTMFYGCYSLSSITCLATNISATYCTKDWVNGVAASGTFTKAASMSSWTTGNKGIPEGWTVQNYQE